MTDEQVRAALAAHVEPLAGRPVEWGVDDCARFAAAWVQRLTGKALDLPRWTSEAEARGLQADPGTEALWRAALAGYPTVNEAGLGDVGLIETRAYGLVGAIGLGDGHALWRTETGVNALLVRQWAVAWAVRP